MNDLIYGIADAFEAMFECLNAVGPLTNWFFGISITVGVVYWLWYDKNVRNGGENYMSDKGK